ncbi:HK97 family phage prohead protease [Echinicola shivajiensis]|uniref:HK97 family phage prohead protease n=1 Tax=Echinicola shivajiensis TaxID=1035916 RepID=UPI001BFC3C2F|nr:HK97 family phage prohead protease [Echinicola shivajiensis]
MNNEIRTFQTEFRAIEEDGKYYISGYALRFNTLSKDFGGWFETIHNEAINDNTVMDDIVCRFNHKDDYILGRSSSNTLEVRVDDEGLFYKCELDLDISYHKDLYLSVKRGDVSKSSFAFQIAEDGEKWEKIDDKYVRTITSFKLLADVAPVVNPAYEDTSVRNFDEVKKELDKVDNFNYKYLIKYNQLKNSII